MLAKEQDFLRRQVAYSHGPWLSKISEKPKGNSFKISYPTHCRCIVSQQAIITQACSPSINKVIIKCVRFTGCWFGCFIYKLRDPCGNSRITEASRCTYIMPTAVDVNKFCTVGVGKIGVRREQIWKNKITLANTRTTCLD